MRYCIALLFIGLYVETFAQATSGMLHANEIMKRFCAICQQEKSLNDELNLLFHKAHSLYSNQKDKERYTDIMKGIELAQQQQQDTLLFFYIF